ncbi:MAG: helix-turn-helix transcriptional regulator [Lachnospiraceae bacterium]|nr:helix-turn-helix transcriptional regulator [Lachnospiraceae bacterium]
MAIGERIKRIRTFRKMTQSQLGDAVGLSDVRIRQYELSNRTPKTDMIQQMAEALDCNYRSIDDPTLYTAEDVMFALFELDEHYDMPLYEVTDKENKIEKHICVGFNYSLMDDFLSEWMKKKQELAAGKITKEEYFEWKIKWPHKD